MGQEVGVTTSHPDYIPQPHAEIVPPVVSTKGTPPPRSSQARGSLTVSFVGQGHLRPNPTASNPSTPLSPSGGGAELLNGGQEA